MTVSRKDCVLLVKLSFKNCDCAPVTLQKILDPGSRFDKSQEKMITKFGKQVLLKYNLVEGGKPFIQRQ